jgi:predicted membrane metal-binding protein
LIGRWEEDIAEELIPYCCSVSPQVCSVAVVICVLAFFESGLGSFYRFFIVDWWYNSTGTKITIINVAATDDVKRMK